MVLHLPHAEAGFGVTFNDVTKDQCVKQHRFGTGPTNK
jgi:hypothetical protein